ncbi:MAG: glycosyltransferase family 4 protein [Flavisolibacter sp.]
MTIAVISMIRDPWGGSEELWYEMAKAAMAQGHKLIHLSFEHPRTASKIKELEAQGLVREIRPGWIPATNSSSEKLVRLGWNYLRRKWKKPMASLFAQKPDIVLYNGTCYSISRERELLQQVRIHKGKTKFFILGHLNKDMLRDISDEEARIIREAYSLSSKVFFVSQRSIDTARRQLCTEILNAEIIRNPVNLQSPGLIPLPSLNDTLNIACVGNLVVAHKGQDLLLEALSKWKEKNWKLNLYGQGADRSYLENLTRFFGMEKRVFFHGSVSDIKEVWKENHLLVMPSHMEGMPLAIVEAMICGRICLATNVGGISEWIDDGKNGYLMESPQIKNIIAALDLVWDAREHWQQMGLNAHEKAMRLYDPKAGASLLNRIIAP